MARICTEEPPEELLRGIGEFNEGRWYDCHETLEELWAGEQGDARELYQGILQVAVALHHWREGNYRGALSLLGSAAKLLRQVAPVCQGVDAAALIRDAERLRATLEDLGPERMEELDPALIPLVGFRGEDRRDGER
jgi:predicted metal-dependent hydrolase